MLALTFLLSIITLAFFVAKYATAPDKGDLLARRTTVNVAFERVNEREPWINFAAIAGWAVISVVISGFNLEAVRMFLVVLWIVGGTNKAFLVLFGLVLRSFYSFSFVQFAWRAIGVYMLVSHYSANILYGAVVVQLVYLAGCLYLTPRPLPVVGATENEVVTKAKS